MGKKRSVDFLSKPTPERLRKEIQNISDSYSHPWDLMSELCQNSVDAIRLHRKRHGEECKRHRIEIELDCKARSIKTFDTGTGIDCLRLAELLAPHGTDKVLTDPVIGEKGVGLTYTIFASNYYEMETKSVTGHVQGYVKKAESWKAGRSADIPRFVYTIYEEGSYNPEDTFTTILLSDVEGIYEESEDVFYQPVPIVEYFLRTRTAIGYLKGCFQKGEQLAIDVNLTLVDMAGQTHKRAIKPSYMTPEEFVASNKVVNIDQFMKDAATLDDRQKARRLQGSCLIDAGATQRAGRLINYYCFFAPTRGLWEDISNKNELKMTDSAGDQIALYEGGIFVGSRGMPTAIRLEAPATGYAGYWPNFYMIIEDDSIVFDLGRKSVPSRTKGLLRDIAGGLFRKFLPFVEYVRTDPAVKQTVSTVQQYEKQQVFQELGKLPDIGVDKICYVKHPDGQEAAVVAIFHELLGAGILKGYSSLKRGYKTTYDLWGMYEIQKDKIGGTYAQLGGDSRVFKLPLIIEFKFKAEDILSDFEDNIKYFTDIDLIVCWDLDEVKFSKRGVKTEILRPEEIFFYGSNYKLIWSGAYNLGTAGEKPVIALRKFIEDYLSKK